jgi:hypothetical protein
MSVDEMSVDKMSVDKMSVDKMSVDKMSVDKMSVDRLSQQHHKNVHFLQSVSYYRSFIDPNATATPDIQLVNINNKAGLSTRYNKKCPADCYQDRQVSTYLSLKINCDL